VKKQNPWNNFWIDKDSNANNWLAENSLENFIDRKKICFINKYINKTKPKKIRNICEFGCGTAKLLCVCLKEFLCKGIGVDFSEKSLIISRKNAEAIGVKAQFRNEDVRSTSFDDGTFDLILSGGLLEHFKDPSIVIKEMFRVLKSGGIFYSDVVPRKYSLYRRREWIRMQESDLMAGGIYESKLGDSYYVREMEDIGFRKVKYKWMGVYPENVDLKYLNLYSILDGTFFAKKYGWYFMLCATK
jgi:ubiquinone/menaquinone biosynthesis C-methylase UbiE